MIELNLLNKYKEGNRLEAKKAVGGLPGSLWETYSAFANTNGGIIMLGIEEKKDGSFNLIGVNDPQKIVKEFWNTINNQNKISLNIISDKDVIIQENDGNYAVLINVPRAERADKPIYINGNPLSGTYRRNGEGDYKCTKEEVQSMLRDASVKTQDMLVLEEMDMSVFDYESVHAYRIRMKYSRPGHVWETLEDEDFLLKLGAVGRGKDGKKHPTAAGLLMFGYEYEIVREYPSYFLDYREQYNGDENRWIDRFVSSDGNWSGNLHDFYFKVYNKLTQDIKVPFKIENGSRIDDTPVHTALREALANCIINADYYGRQGVVVIKGKSYISLSNPGNFRISLDAAKGGGISDPRNASLIKMFNLIDIGERAGSGIPNIYRIWNSNNWKEPVFEEQFDPDRVSLKLFIEETAIKNGDKKTAIKNGDKKTAIKSERKQEVLSYLANNSYAKTAEIAEAIGLKPSKTRDYLKELANEGLIIAVGTNKNRVYKLKK